MFESNLGVSGSDPTIYLPNDTALTDIFLDAGGYAVYPTRDSGHAYVGAADQKWSFAFSTGIGNDVPATEAIDIVSVTFFGALTFNKTIHAYFKTGGIKYYLGLQQGQSQASPPADFRYGEGGASGTHNWFLNPATNLPWTKAAIIAGEFGFETNGDFTVYGAYVSIYWGYGLTPATGPGGTPEATPCGQSVTLAQAFTNFEAKILEVKPSYGALAGGTQITIRGYNFLPGASVTIGGLPATGVQYLDDQHYVATVPAHAVGFADVVINEAAGTSLVYQNGFQYTLFTRGEDIRRTPGVSINLGLNTGANTCSFMVDGDSNPPKVGEKIQIIDEFTSPRRLLFAGNVQTVEQIYEGLNTQLAWNVSAVDFTWLLNRRRPFGEYHNMSASAIVKDLINKYAPGFTTKFVQTNLAKISIAFDGSWDLQTCLSVIARMIGGGHWYADFTQDLHFFHIVPPDVNMPTVHVTSQAATGTGSLVRVGPGSAPTVAQDALFSSNFSFTPGIYFFQVSFIYSNGTESGFGPAAVVALDGQHKVAFSNIAIGAAAGALTVIKRRIYYKFNGIVGGGKRTPFLQIDDNTTTAFVTPGFAPQNNTDIAGVSSVLGQVAPAEAPVAAPAYAESTSVPNASGTSTPSILCQAEYRPAGQTSSATWTPGKYCFRVADIYQDLTESQLGPASVAFQSDGVNLVHLNNVPIGVAVNGATVVARRIYGALGDNPADEGYFSWHVIPNNTATTADVAPMTGNRTGSSGGVQQPAPEQNPVWPNDDGPFLENFDRPEDVTDDSIYLMRSPQVTSTVDLSQIRNRIQIRGGGSTTSDIVAAGSSQIPVVDCSFYSVNGGQVFIEGQIANYRSITANSGPGTLTLDNPVGEQINSGAPVALYLMVEDKTSQDDLGRVELDANGLPTDGIHEFVIVDTSLQTPSQMFMRGMAELELYARPITSVRYSTRDPKTRPGAKVTIKLRNPPIAGEFLIQSVSIDQIHNEADDTLEPRYNVTTSSNKFDLNDLFFQWNIKTANPASGGGGGTGSSPQPSAPSEPAPSPVAAGTVPGVGNTNMWTGVSPATGVKFDQVWGSSFTTAITYVTDSQGYWMRMGNTSTGEGGQTTQASIPNTATFRADQGFLYSMWVRLDQFAAAGDQIIIAGLFDGGGAMTYDGPANGNTRHVNDARKFIGFRLGGNGWSGMVGDGQTMNEYLGLHGASPYGVYNMAIRVVSPAQIATPTFGAFYKTNFPAGVIELSVVQTEEITRPYRIALPPSLLSTGLSGFAMLYNGQQPSPNTTKTFDINTASGALGNGI